MDRRQPRLRAGCEFKLLECANPKGRPNGATKPTITRPIKPDWPPLWAVNPPKIFLLCPAKKRMLVNM
jgi:hypothetical protein